MKDGKIVIELDKKKVIQYIVIIVLVFLVCVVSFAVSNSNSEKYSKSTTSTDLEGEEDILQLATKEAGEVKDEERVAPNEISTDDYINFYNGDESKLILFSSPSCSYCKIAVPILENLIYEYKIDMNYINTADLSNEDRQKIMESNEYFSEGFGTPLMLVVKDGNIVDKIDGLVDRESYIAFFKEYGFME